MCCLHSFSTIKISIRKGVQTWVVCSSKQLAMQTLQIFETVDRRIVSIVACMKTAYY